MTLLKWCMWVFSLPTVSTATILQPPDVYGLIHRSCSNKRWGRREGARRHVPAAEDNHLNAASINNTGIISLYDNNNKLTEKGVHTDLPGKQLMHDSPTTIMPITQSHRCQWAGWHFQHQCNHFQESYTNVMITLDFKLLQQLDNCFYFLLLF